MQETQQVKRQYSDNNDTLKIDLNFEDTIVGLLETKPADNETVKRKAKEKRATKAKPKPRK